MMTEITQLLFDKYGATLTTIETAEVIGRSKASLELDRRNAEGIPYKRLGSSPTSPVRYLLSDVITWLTNTTKTA